MKRSDFQKAGDGPTLLAAFLPIDIGFTTWTALAPLKVDLATRWAATSGARV